MGIGAIGGMPQVDMFSNYRNGFATTSSRKYTENNTYVGREIDMDKFAFTPEYLASLVNKEDKKIGFLGDEDCDVVYIPDQIVKKMPQIDELPRAARLEDLINMTFNNATPKTTFEMSKSFSDVSSAWSDYYKVLNSFGINHNDSNSLQKLFQDNELKAQVDEAFSKII